MGATVATHPPRDWEGYSSCLLSPAFWRPLLELVGARERIGVGGARPGEPAGTFPTFICGSRVIKLYTQLVDGRTGFDVERTVLEALADGPVPTARLLAAGEVELGGVPYWYLVVSRVRGGHLSTAWPALGPGERLALASELGGWGAMLHATDVPAKLRELRGPYVDFLVARRAGLAQRLVEWGSLEVPKHAPLVRQLPHSLAEAAPAFVDHWLLADPPAGEALLHGDLHRDHVVGGGSPWRPKAVIDFGDARGGCPLYELGPLVTSTFDGDRGLLDAFLASYGWDIADRDLFARRALATALLHDFDIFADWRERVAGVRSLDELAMRMFGPVPAFATRK